MSRAAGYELSFIAGSAPTAGTSTVIVRQNGIRSRKHNESTSSLGEPVMGEPIMSKLDVEVDIYSTINLGVAINLKFPKGMEAPAFLSPAQAREAADRLIAAAEENEKKDV